MADVRWDVPGPQLWEFENEDQPSNGGESKKVVPAVQHEHFFVPDAVSEASSYDQAPPPPTAAAEAETPGPIGQFMSALGMGTSRASGSSEPSALPGAGIEGLFGWGATSAPNSRARTDEAGVAYKGADDRGGLRTFGGGQLGESVTDAVISRSDAGSVSGLITMDAMGPGDRYLDNQGAQGGQLDEPEPEAGHGSGPDLPEPSSTWDEVGIPAMNPNSKARGIGDELEKPSRLLPSYTNRAAGTRLIPMNDNGAGVRLGGSDPPSGYSDESPRQEPDLACDPKPVEQRPPSTPEPLVVDFNSPRAAAGGALSPDPFASAGPITPEAVRASSPGLPSPDRPRQTSPGIFSKGSRASDASLPDHLVQKITPLTTFWTMCPATCVSVGLLIILLVLSIGLPLLDLEIEYDLQELTTGDGKADALYGAFMEALNEQARMASGLPQEVTMLWSVFDVHTAYELKEGSDIESIFSFDAVSEVARFERELRGMPEWQELCSRTDAAYRSLCDPGVSFASYAIPTAEFETGRWTPSRLAQNGLGTVLMPLQPAFRMLEDHGMSGTLLESGFDASAYQSYSSIRSVFRFRILCCTSRNDSSYQSATASKLRTEWDSFVQEVLLPKLQDPGLSYSTVNGEAEWPIRVYFQGTRLKNFEVAEAMSRDVYFVIGSLLFVFGYLLFHIHSLVLSVMGVILIISSVFMAYVFSAVLAGTAKMNIVSFVAIFLAIALGSDYVFVYTDIWRDSKKLDSEASRLAFVARHGGACTGGSALSTAFSFLACLASSNRPMRHFGLYMFLCVMLAWVLVSFIYVPTCIVEERHLECCRIRCHAERAPRRKPRWRSWLRSKWMGHIQYWRRWYILVWVALLLVTLVRMSVKVETGYATIFPEDHNQNRGTKTFQRYMPVDNIFGPLSEAPPTASSICNETSGAHDQVNCSFYWCDSKASVEVVSENAEKCQCYSHPLPVTPKCGDQNSTAFGTATKATRLVGATSGSPSELATELATPDGNTSGYAMPPMLLQEWTSGNTSFLPVVEVRSTLPRSDDTEPCGTELWCFCGRQRCQLDDTWQVVDHITLSSRRALTDTWTVAPRFRAVVYVVYGMTIDIQVPVLAEPEPATWSFRGLDLADPWAQRDMSEFCRDLSPDLRITDKRCWMRDFRLWVLQETGERWPALPYRFNDLFTRFLAEGTTGTDENGVPIPSARYLWMQDDAIQACYFSFVIDVSKDASASVVATNLELWNSAVSGNKWHTSELWAQSVEEEITSSTRVVLILAIVFVFVILVIFTLDIVLAFLVVLCSLGVLSGLAFIIFTILGWTLGPAESIGLIAMIGYAVTFTLNIAKCYGVSSYGTRDVLAATAPEGISQRGLVRFQRASFAIQTIGAACVGNAITTLGTTGFLLFCEVAIFKKMGGIFVIVTFLGITSAMGPLTAMLLCVGPVRPRWCPRTFADCVEIAEKPGKLIGRVQDSVRRNIDTAKAEASRRRNAKAASAHAGDDPEAPIESRGDAVNAPRGMPDAGVTGHDRSLPPTSVLRVDGPNLPPRRGSVTSQPSDEAQSLNTSEMDFEIGSERTLEPIQVNAVDNFARKTQV